MTALTTNPSVQALAWTLVHFLWQGAAIGVGVFLWIRLRQPSAQARYAAGILALAALLAAPVATFLRISPSATPADRSAVAVMPPPSGEPAGALAEAPAPGPTPVPSTVRVAATEDDQRQASSPAATAIVAAWAAGVLLLSLRLAGGWLVARRLTARGTVPAAVDVRDVATRLAARLGLRRAVRLVESTAVSVPVLVGWLKPVVLFPTAALSGLSAGQIEALLAHELAHVRRHDYAVNILQSIVETLLFYHPAVWFVSSQVREAREQCCDDLAIGVCDRVVYVRALADLAGMAQAPGTALAATGGSLLRRVQRLLGQPGPERGPGAAWLGVLVLALVGGGVMPAALGSAGARDDSQAARGGVAGGELGGVAGGVAGGLAGGVAGGVTGGIAGGVSGGGGEGVAGDADGQSQVEREREALRIRRAESEYEALRVRAARLEEQLRQGLASPDDVRVLEARLADLERVVAAGGSTHQGGTGMATDPRSTAQLEARAARALGEVEAARRALESNLELHAVGLVAQSAVQVQEGRLSAAVRDLTAVTVEIQAVADEAATRITLDARRAQLQAELQIGHAEAELMGARRTMDAMRNRVEVGLAPPDGLAEAEARVQAIERQLVAARVESQLAKDESALRRQRIEVLRRLASEMQDAGARYALRGDPSRPEAPVVTDPAARVQAGDVLSIQVTGEPDLPRSYPVDTRGTIRLPLMNPIEVAGLTAQQVREAVAAALAQRGLAGTRTVTVTLRRPK